MYGMETGFVDTIACSLNTGLTERLDLFGKSFFLLKELEPHKLPG